MPDNVGILSLAAGLVATITGVVFSAGKLFQRTQVNKEELAEHKRDAEGFRESVIEGQKTVMTTIEAVGVRLDKRIDRLEDKLLGAKKE